MKKITKKLGLIFLVLALLLPSTLMVSAEKADEPTYAAPSGGKLTSTSVAGGKSTVIKHSSMRAGVNKYAQTNKDIKAWLYVPNTNMNFPIVQPTNDNLHYMNRTWEGKDYPNNNYKNYIETATYTDSRVKFGNDWKTSSRNIVLYGHNWTNLKAPFDIGNTQRHKMFGQLPSYTDINFAKNNPYIYFSTANMEGVWKVFSVAYIESDVNNFYYNTTNPSTDRFDTMLSEFKQRSLFNFDVDVNTNDQIITLDTCIRQYSNVGSGQRFVVVARLLREGETENDPVTVVANPNIKVPSFT